jgi:hypothetical protein
VDGRREPLGQALGVDATADAIVDTVTAIRDAPDLPTKLDAVAGPPPEEFPAVAETILEDPFMANAPPGLAPTRADIEAILHAACRLRGGDRRCCRFRFTHWRRRDALQIAVEDALLNGVFSTY